MKTMKWKAELSKNNCEIVFSALSNLRDKLALQSYPTTQHHLIARNEIESIDKIRNDLMAQAKKEFRELYEK